MTLVTLRPNATTSSTGVTVTGAGSVHAALADNSDSSYVLFDGVDGTIRVALTDLTLPTGARLVRGAVRLRGCLLAGGPPNSVVYAECSAGVPPITGLSLPTWASPATWTIGTTDTPGTDAQIDASDLKINVSVIVPGYTPSPVRIHEAFVDIAYALKPVVTVTGPADGSTITTTNKPTVTWADTFDADGGPQQLYEVRVFSAAQYGAVGFDPETSTPTASTDGAGSALSWQSTRLPNAVYRAYVRTAQTSASGRLLAIYYSDWDYNQFTVNVPVPHVPAMTLTPEPSDGRVRIDLVHIAGAVSTTGLEIERSTDHINWAALRLDTDTAGVIDAADATVFDMEAGNGHTTYYRARALHGTGDDLVASDWVDGDTVWESREWWLKSPLHPSLNMPVVVHSQASYQQPARQGSFQALGATNALVVSDTRGADRGTVVFRVDTDSAGAALKDLLNYGGVLLLQGAPQDHWTDRYISPGDLDRGRLADKAFIEGTLDTLPWIEVDSPTGPVDEWPDFALY